VIIEKKRILHAKKDGEKALVKMIKSLVVCMAIVKRHPNGVPL